MEVNVLIFGKLRDLTGTNICRVSDVKDTDQMIAKMNEKFPGLSAMKFLIAVEEDIVHENTVFSHEHTVALLPPYSGG